jgi:hypothetical protein
VPPTGSRSWRRSIRRGAVGFSLAACDSATRKGPAERAGEKIDKGASKIGEKIEEGAGFTFDDTAAIADFSRHSRSVTFTVAVSSGDTGRHSVRVFADTHRLVPNLAVVLQLEQPIGMI